MTILKKKENIKIKNDELKIKNLSLWKIKTKIKMEIRGNRFNKEENIK